MSNQNRIQTDVDKIKSSEVQQPTDDVFTSHIRLSNIFATLIDFDGDQADYDSTTLNSLQSTMSSSSSSNPVSIPSNQFNFLLLTELQLIDFVISFSFFNIKDELTFG